MMVIVTHVMAPYPTFAQSNEPTFARSNESVIGRITAWRSGKVSTQVPGLVKRLKVRIGDRVAKGGILAVFDTSQLERDLAQADARLTASRARVAIASAKKALQQNIYSRLRRLRRSPAFLGSKLDEAGLKVKIAKAEVLAAKADVKIAQANYRRTKLDIALSTIKAPYSGVVMRLFTQVGAFVTPEEPHILELIDNRSLEIEVDLSTESAATLKRRAVIYVRVNGQKKFRARLRAILPQVTRNTQTRAVRFTPLDTKRVHALTIGQNVEVFLPKAKTLN